MGRRPALPPCTAATVLPPCTHAVRSIERQSCRTLPSSPVWPLVSTLYCPPVLPPLVLPPVARTRAVRSDRAPLMPYAPSGTTHAVRSIEPLMSHAPSSSTPAVCSIEHHSCCTPCQLTPFEICIMCQTIHRSHTEEPAYDLVRLGTLPRATCQVHQLQRILQHFPATRLNLLTYAVSIRHRAKSPGIVHPHPAHLNPTHQRAAAAATEESSGECLVDTRANSNFVRSRRESRGVSGPLRDSPACPEPARKHDSRFRAPRVHVGGVGQVWPRALRLGGGGCQLTYGALARYGGQLLLGGDQALVLVL